ncbi:MAG: glycoside hydrolase family 57 protein, partial [Campylobacterota bacterium]
MQQVKLSFLWHMHQPYYKDDIKDTTFMPWVFLHGIKDYYDIPNIAAKCGIKATFNLVPSLLEQLQDYANNTDNDLLLHSIEKEITALHEGDKDLLNRYIFSANEENMIKPLPRYYQLYEKHKAHNHKIGRFSPNELLDAQVLFLLSWCGESLRQDRVVKELIEQGIHFSQEQKLSLLQHLRSFVGGIIPLYKRLHHEGKILLATTPYFHPITPLLLDKNAAVEANPHTTLPQTHCDLSQLASVQLDLGLQKFEAIFGFTPTILWPAEGGVSQKALQLFKSRGIEWIGADEEILFRSCRCRELYKRYSYEGVNIAFRDKRLSDMIGFEFSQLDADVAVERFVQYIEKNRGNETFINVILDGE